MDITIGHHVRMPLVAAIITLIGTLLISRLVSRLITFRHVIE